jgi:hypothetical protein
VEAEGTFPVPESCLEKPDSHCTSQPLLLPIHALANHSLLQRCLKFSADPRSGIALRKTADSHHCRCRRCRQFRRCPEGFDSFSDKFVRGLQPPKSIQNRTACRAPTVAKPSPHDIAANSPNSSPHSQSPRLRGLSPRPGLSNDYYETSGPIGSNERSSPAHAATPIGCGDCPRDRGRFVATITNLWVPSFLTKAPATPHCHFHRCGDCPRDRVAE